MHVVVFGLGYVGLVSAACLAAEGHRVTGVDISDVKVRLVNEGRSPIIEVGVPERLDAARAAGRLEATTDAIVALETADLALVCVGTPTDVVGGVDTRAVEAVVRDVAVLSRENGRIVPIIIRSTVPVGTSEKKLLSLWRTHGPREDDTPPLVFHPEFLREGSAVADYYDPPRIVIGESVEGSEVGNVLLGLYSGFEAPVFRVEYATAELLKYCDNVFHALKIAFANEVGLLARANEVDSRTLMEMFCADRKLNISEKYLRPGFAFGGSCLPKDLRGFLVMAQEAHLELPLVSSIAETNRALIERAAQAIVERHISKIGFYGLAFKPNTDDLRESPLVLLAERVLGKGMEITIVDGSVDEARLVGGNEAYVNLHLPHLGRLMASNLDALGRCELVVLGHPARPELVTKWLEAGITVFDLAGIQPRPAHSGYVSLT